MVEVEKEELAVAVDHDGRTVRGPVLALDVQKLTVVLR